jgi:hypothetical protein
MTKYKGFSQVSATAIASATATASGSATSSGSATATATATSKLSQESANEKAFKTATATANKDALSLANYNAKTNAYDNALKEVKKQLFPSVGALKTVFLLELSAGIQIITDNNIKETLEYYWNSYPEEFSSCPIEDTKGSMEILLSLLDKYYAAGYKYFSGFTSSNVFSAVIPWFNDHPAATGITTFGNLSSLDSIPKNMYRLTPTNLIRTSSIVPYITSKNVYFVYTRNLIAIDELENSLIEYKEEKIINSLKTYEGDFTLESLMSFFSDATKDDVAVLCLVGEQQKYINLYSEGLTFPGEQYDILAIRTPVIPVNSSLNSKLNGKYHLSQFIGISTSILWRNGNLKLGSKFSFSVIGQLNLLNVFNNSGSFNNCNGHLGITEFDQGTKYLLYPNLLINNLLDGVFVPEKLYLEDPIVGTYTANFVSTQTVPQNYIPMNPRNVFGKAVALLEINNPNLNFDTILNYAIYHYWNYDKTLPRFPITNTYKEGDDDATIIQKNIDLLNKYYSDGYRIFFGFSRSTILKGVNDWFVNHTDTVALSCFSTSIDSVLIDRKNTNLYRLEYSDNYIVDSILTKIENTYDKIFYFYSGNENAAINIKNYIAENVTGEFLSYNIDAIGNYTASSINDFFRENGVTENSVVILYIFNEQNYYDLYNSPDLKNYSKRQYSILNQSTPIITGVNAQEKLNELNYILTASPNTSKIWRDNSTYLSDKFDSDTNSAGLLDALKMIEYLQDKKPTNLLGSHNGTLQFNDKGDRMFPSYLQLTYKKETNTFVNNSIIFDDSLLGKFKADL